MSGRERILDGVRRALEDRERPAHPGSFGSWGRESAWDGAGAGSTERFIVDRFIEMFEQAGGSVVRLASRSEAEAWLTEFAGAFGSGVVGTGVPPFLRPDLPEAPADTAALGVSMADLAVAETGSVVLDARDGRRAQLLPPVHLMWVKEQNVRATLAQALTERAGDLPSALALHSGPSKSADIGQVLVTGVHGPGRVVVGLLAGDDVA